MAPERIVLCGGTSGRGLSSDVAPLRLNCYGTAPNVRLQLGAVRRALWKPIPPLLRDLLDVAAYVYAADQAITRADGGRVDGDEVGAGWRRNFRFRIPVRQPDVWNAAPVRKALIEVLSFLSEDEYAFEFPHLVKDTSLDGHITYDSTPCDGMVDEVIMFSGGLDSLAGAVLESIVGRRQVLLVNHRPTQKLTPRHQRLVRRLQTRAGERAPMHFPVVINKVKQLGREHTQRTRSFLFTALGTLFARMIGLSRLRFYENGVVSFNLPLTAQIVGARASRTTHPRVFAGFQYLLTTLLGERFEVDNPFLWETKADVVRRLRDAECADLIGLSTSCGHTWALPTKRSTHCGVCSQCIDRRFAVLSAGQEAHDPAQGYAVDLLTGDREDLEARTMLAAYLELAERVEGMDEGDFVIEFPELTRIIPHIALPAASAVKRTYAMYWKHAHEVNGVIERAIAANAQAIRRRTLPEGCLLRLVYDYPAPETLASPIEPSLEGNYFLRSGRGWRVRFGTQDEQFYLPERGFEYLCVLLTHPNRSFSASELVSRVSTQHASHCPRATTLADAIGAGTGITNCSSGDPALDEEAIEALLTRLREIERCRPLAEVNDSPARLEVLDDLDRETRDINRQLALNQRRGGGARRLGDMRNRVRNRVCNAIRRAITQIADYDPALAAHLARPVLNLGHTITYFPRGDTRWTVND